MRMQTSRKLHCKIQFRQQNISVNIHPEETIKTINPKKKNITLCLDLRQKRETSVLCIVSRALVAGTLSQLVVTNVYADCGNNLSTPTGWLLLFVLAVS